MMRTRGRLGILGVSCLLIVGASVRGELLFEQIPLHGGGTAGDLDFYTDTGQPFSQQAADDFRLTSDALITRVSWFGFYGGRFLGSTNPPTGPETMRIRFYSARAMDGLPDQLLYEQSIVNPPRNPTGASAFDVRPHPEFVFDVDLASPFLASANTAYWLEVLQVDSLDSTFRWESSDYAKSSHDFVFLNQLVPDWTASGSNVDLAFRLSNVPESGPVCFFLELFVATLGFRRPRRRQIGV